MWGPYVVELLQRGLRLEEASVRVGSGDVAWPLGAALVEGSRLPELMPAAAAGKGAPGTGGVFRWWHAALLAGGGAALLAAQLACPGLLAARLAGTPALRAEGSDDGGGAGVRLRQDSVLPVVVAHSRLVHGAPIKLSPSRQGMAVD